MAILPQINAGDASFKLTQEMQPSQFPDSDKWHPCPLDTKESLQRDLALEEDNFLLGGVRGNGMLNTNGMLDIA
jgi:hypothetical protein